MDGLSDNITKFAVLSNADDASVSKAVLDVNAEGTTTDASMADVEESSVKLTIADDISVLEADIGISV